MKLNSAIFCILAASGLYFEVVLDFLQTHVVGDWNRLVGIIGLVIVDFALGLTKAIKFKNFKSRKIWPAPLRAVGYFVLAFAMVSFEKTSDNAVFDYVEDFTSSFVFTAFAIMELASIIENLGALNLKIPAIILSKFEDFNNKTGKYEPKNGKEETKKEKELEKVA